MKKLFVVAALAFLSACTYGSLNIEREAAIREVEKKLPAIAKGNAQVCFIREENSLNMLPGVAPDILIDNTTVGELQKYSYFCHNTQPGKHEFIANSVFFLTKQEMDATLKSDQRTFIEWVIRDWGLMAIASLRELTPEVGLSKIYRITR